MDEQRWHKRLARERNARLEAENILLHKAEALHQANLALEASLDRISESNKRAALSLWASKETLWSWRQQDDQLTLFEVADDLTATHEQHLSWSAFLERIVPTDRPLILQAWEAHLWRNDQSMLDVECRYLRDGETRWCRIRGQVTQRSEGDYARQAAGTLRDITASRRKDEDLYLLAAAFENTSAGMAILDPQWHILQVNKAFSQGVNTSPGAAVGQPISRWLGEAGASSLIAEIKQRTVNEGRWSGELELSLPEGTQRFLATVSALYGVSGTVTHHVVSIVDISKRFQYEQQLQQLANYDSLTRLPNRSSFLSRLQDEITAADRSKQAFAVVFFDLDRFKQINDSLGHTAGDQLLCKISERLLDHFRKTDLVARLGGDEFAFILNGLPRSDLQPGITRRLDMLLALFDQPFPLQTRQVLIKPSIGVSLYPQDGENVSQLLQHADIAMYQAKKTKQRYRYFSPGMYDAALQRLELENDLRGAIENRELSLAWQPKVEASTGRIEGAEVLLRWIHPQRGFVSPADFIPVAEESGSILAITEWIFDEVCKSIRALPPEYLSGRIAVNLSARHFSYYDLPAFLDRVLDTHGLKSECLELEITEGILMTDMSATAEKLALLREKRFTIAIDDFGTGFSSLSYLRNLPVDVLKVDRSFVSAITEGVGGAAIADTVVALGRNLGLKTVAEGVETDEEVQHLKRQGCDSFQGYFFYRPLSFEDFRAALKSSLEGTAAP